MSDDFESTLSPAQDAGSRSQPAAQELEGLRADRAELEIFWAEERERAQLKDRQAVLDTPRNKRCSGRPREGAA